MWGTAVETIGFCGGVKSAAPLKDRLTAASTLSLKLLVLSNSSESLAPYLGVLLLQSSQVPGSSEGEGAPSRPQELLACSKPGSVPHVSRHHPARSAGTPSGRAPWRLEERAMEAKLQSHPLGRGFSVGIKAHVVQWVPRQRGAWRSQPHACSPLPQHGQVPAGRSAGAPTPAG